MASIRLRLSLSVELYRNAWHLEIGPLICRPLSSPSASSSGLDGCRYFGYAMENEVGGLVVLNCFDHQHLGRSHGRWWVMVFGRQQQEPISYIIIRYFVPSKTILPERGPITTPKDVLCQRRWVGEEGKHTRFQSHEEFLFVILGRRGQTYKAATASLNIYTKAFRVNDCHYYLMLSRNIFPCSRNYL